MKIECKGCHKIYDIPNERLPEGDKVSFPCPACQEFIHLDFSGQVEQKETPDSSTPSDDLPRGEALKKKILRGVSELPPMPQTVMKAREVMGNRDSSFLELAKVLETDQAIASKVLKLSNSAYYGMMGKVSSIQHASVVLGMKTLGELITMAGSSDVLGEKLEGYGLNAGDLWQHSLGVAFGSKLIAGKKNPGLADDAFTAGLIHDAGKLVLDQYILERQGAFKKLIEEGQESFLSAEKKILGFDHAEIAFDLCKSWNVPKMLTGAIKYHHVPSKSNGDDLAFIIHMSDALAMMSGVGAGIDGMAYEMDGQAMELLGLQEEDLPGIMEEMAESVMKITS